MTETQPNIEDIIVNVNKKEGCACGAIKKIYYVRKRGWNGKLPETQGHIMFTGRECKIRQFLTQIRQF